MQIDLARRLAKKVVVRSATEALYLKTGINLTKPNDIRATLTERCNYKCMYCDHWRREAYTDEMSLEQWQAALMSVRDYVGRYAVQFLGGEPMITPWFFSLVQFCRDNDIDWGVITNGSSLNSVNVSKIVIAKPMNVDISIDSRDPIVNDQMRGVKNAMQRAGEGVRRLFEQRRDGDHDFAIRLKPTITRQTIGSLGAMVDWAETMPGVLVDFSPVRLLDKKDIEDLYPTDPIEFDRLTRQIESLVERKKNGAPIETSPEKLWAIVPHFRDNKSLHGVNECRTGLRSINIKPNGSVEHCFKFTDIGNINNVSMKSIWEDNSRRDMINNTLSCQLFNTTCSTSCLSHRSFAQDVRRGLTLARHSRL